MKITTFLSSAVLSLISLNAFADCTISVGRFQQQQQQQAQHQGPVRGEAIVAIEQAAKFEYVNVDQCIDLFESTRKTLETRPETSANRVLIIDFDYRGLRLSSRTALQPPQQQQQSPQY